MILSDGEISDEIRCGNLVIEALGAPIKNEQIQPSSVDLRLGPNISIFKDTTVDDGSWWGKARGFDPHKDDASKLMDSLYMEDGFTLLPGHFLLAHTVEHVKLPNDLVGVVDGRSSMGRLGVMVHITAGYIDPGFHGQITLEMHNVGPLAIQLRPGDRICQIRFHRMARAAEHPYAGKYQGDKGAVSSRLNRDFQKE